MFNLDEKAKVCSAQLSEEVIFWKWISPKIIGLVTEASVYHWSIFSEGASASPEKVFDRHSSLSGCQIINYRQDPTGRWLLLVGISAHQGRVVGSMQLYNRDKNVSQPIEGHMGAFTEINLVGSSVKTRIFTFAVRSAASAKVARMIIDALMISSCTLSKLITLRARQSFLKRQSSYSFLQRLQMTFQWPCRLLKSLESCTWSPNMDSFTFLKWKRVNVSL